MLMRKWISAVKQFHDVIKSLLYEDQDVQEQLDSRNHLGQKVADEVARFGGSWVLSCHSLLFMAIWMGLNVIQPLWDCLWTSIHLFC